MEAVAKPSAEIYMLGGTVKTSVGELEENYTKVSDRWFIMALVFAGDKGVSYRRLSHATGLDTTSGALRQRKTRIQASSGLKIEAVGGDRYRLDLNGIRVDVFDFLGLVESQTADSALRRESLRRARAMWQGGLPVFAEPPLPDPDVYARVSAADQLVRSGGRRILVVDDKIGHSLAERLRLDDHECEVATSRDEYRQFEPRLGDFDLVVLDRHLTGEYNDRMGDRIAERINQRTDGVPVMMMTLDVPDNLDLPTWQSELGLAGATRKKVDGEGADLTLLTEMVGAILKDGPVNRACSALEAGMAALRRRAEKLLHKQHTEPRLTRLIEDMDRAVTEIVTIARRNDLRKAREARRAFVAQWLGGNQ